MGCNWVLPPYDSAPGALVAAVFQANGVSPPKPLVKTIAIQLTVSLIASGEFVGILPRSAAVLSAHQSALKILPLKSSGPRISAEIVFLNNRTLIPAVVAFMNCARKVAISLAPKA
jgi:DNA-binding transcriptional LysR family regulator